MIIPFTIYPLHIYAMELLHIFMMLLASGICILQLTCFRCIEWARVGGGKSIAITPHTARRQSRERLAGNQVARVDVVVVGPQTKSITIARLKTMQLSSHYTNAESAATNDNPEYTSNQRIRLNIWCSKAYIHSKYGVPNFTYWLYSIHNLLFNRKSHDFWL